ncbi:TatD family hydrolase [Singulisphaera rosea]
MMRDALTTPTLVDTHAHLDDPRLYNDLDAVLTRARLAGVGQVVAIGTTAEDSGLVAAIARERPGVFAAVGIHPNHITEARDGDWERILSLIGQPKVVAVGETGLDRYRDNTPFELQQESFDRHLSLARECDLPVVIHCRESARDILDQLNRGLRPIRGILHSFTGSWDEACEFLELGLHLSFAGMLTFENKSLDDLRDVASRIPLDRLLVETDSPYLSPHPFRGKTNEPARVALTAETLARLKDIPVASLAEITTANARKLFRLPDDDRLV